MSEIKIDQLAAKIVEKRAEKGVREAAREVGVSPATLSRIENRKVPDLETFGKVCRWLGEDPAEYLGLRSASASDLQNARVHFKKGVAIRKDSARALGEMILKAQQALLEEDQEG